MTLIIYATVDSIVVSYTTPKGRVLRVIGSQGLWELDIIKELKKMIKHCEKYS